MTVFNVEVARKRAAMMASIRSFFAERAVLEVETPTLCSGVAPDCHIDLFETAFQVGTAQSGGKRYLLSSPELPMKRLLASGFPDLFQLSRVYRNGEVGRIHNPEFTMLEWYRRGYDMRQLIEEVQTFFTRLLEVSAVEIITYQNVVKKHTGIDPLATTVEDVKVRLKDYQRDVPEFSSLTDALVYMMALIVEPELDPQTLTIVYNYPKDQAVLSVVAPDDSRVARRFEVYFKGVELANGFEELTDPEENEQRFRNENTRRVSEGKSPLHMDEKFLNDLKQGMPSCAGVAVGIDRLLMCKINAASIEEVLSFSWQSS